MQKDLEVVPLVQFVSSLAWQNPFGQVDKHVTLLTPVPFVQETGPVVAVLQDPVGQVDAHVVVVVVPFVQVMTPSEPVQ